MGPGPLPGDNQASSKLADSCYGMLPAGVPRPYSCSSDVESRSPLSIRNSPGSSGPVSPTAPDDLSLSKRMHSPVNVNNNGDSAVNVDNNDNVNN